MEIADRLAVLNEFSHVDSEQRRRIADLVMQAEVLRGEREAEPIEETARRLGQYLRIARR